MAESAFGVEHGDGIEFSKGFGAVGGALKPVGQAGKGFKTGWKAKGNDFTPMKPNRTQGFQRGAQAGAFAQRNKTAIGAGAGGAGLAGGSMGMNNSYQNRHRPVPQGR